jgi:hypothetical protein
MFDPIVRELPLAPLGAGDLIDRAVLLYRRHLFVLIRIAAPPVIVTASGFILVSIAWRQVFQTPSSTAVALYILLGFAGLAVILGGLIFNFVVMGGAARVLVAHLLRNEAVTARATYQAVRQRFGGLVLAAFLVVVWLILSAMAALMGSYIVFFLLGLLSFLLARVSEAAMVVGAIFAVLVALVFSTWIFFFIAGRVAYVPQIMLVEGRSVFESFGRSFSLAHGNVRRLIVMTLFTTFATYSALMILVIPLGLYGYLSGINPWNSAQWPAWYTIGYSVAGPLSFILLTPIWMLGLSLLYMDERVRHEGYDIELMATRQLSEMPDVDVSSPFGPALSANLRKLPPPPLPMPTGSVLNLR